MTSPDELAIGPGQRAFDPWQRVSMEGPVSGVRARAAGTVRLPEGRKIWRGPAIEPVLEKGRSVGSTQAEQERFINAVLDIAGALVVVLDAQGRVVRFNGACERLTGYRSAEVVGRQLCEVVIPPSDVDDVRACLADLRTGAFPKAYENRWVTRSGGQRLIAWENTCLTDATGSVTNVISTGRDITETRRGDDALRAIETVGRLLADQGPVPAALDAILGELETRMGYQLLSLYLRDAHGLRLEAQRGYPVLPEYLDTGTGVIGRVYRSDDAALVPDVSLDPDYLAGSPRTVTEIAVPLHGEVTLGVLNIESAQPGGLTSADLRFAGAVADRLSTALLLDTEQHALRDRARLFVALSEFAGVANAILDPGRLVAALVEAVSTVVPSDTIVITTLDRNDGLYRVRAVRGLAEEAVGVIIPPGDGNTGRAIAARAVTYTDHHARGQYASALRALVKSDSMAGIAVPLLQEGVVLGVISMGRAGSAATFTDLEREVLALLGSQAALALANAYLVEEVSALAIHDALTGLYNRRHFDAALDLAIARYRRRFPAGKLSAIMFDLDHFGEFNRLHGHLVGDEMLRVFGGILQGRLRSADLVARYGGEEFIVILEDASLADTLRVADEVRRELAARAVRGGDGELVHATVSAGCAEIHSQDPTMDDLIGRADIGLFAAKEAGRNRVVAA